MLKIAEFSIFVGVGKNEKSEQSSPSKPVPHVYKTPFEQTAPA